MKTAWLFLSQIAGAFSACCQSKFVGGSDARAGTYYFNGTNTDLPVFCMDSCVYIKTNDLSGDKYCFGDGDINAQCQGEDVDTGFNPPANPPANPEETANEDRSFSYLTNDFPGANTDNIQCGQTISLSTESWSHIYDIEGYKTPSSTASAWSNSGLVLRRLDGASTGTAAYNHLIGIFAQNPSNERDYRLDINMINGGSVNNQYTRFKIVGADGSACSGDVQYESELRLITEDGNYMVDLSTNLVSWMNSDEGTILHISNPSAM